MHVLHTLNNSLKTEGTQIHVVKSKKQLSKGKVYFVF